LVDDDIVDAIAVQRALDDLGTTEPLVHLSDGERALEYLRSDVDDKPSVILLDVNMPRVGGVEFLKAVKADNTLKQIPVVVLTTSNRDRDVLDSFKLSVAGYVVKPVDHEQFVQTIRTITEYWTLSRLPTTGEPAEDPAPEGSAC
jgi:CheY-like chemotaxis protein